MFAEWKGNSCDEDTHFIEPLIQTRVAVFFAVRSIFWCCLFFALMQQKKKTYEDKDKENWKWCVISSMAKWEKIEMIYKKK